MKGVVVTTNDEVEIRDFGKPLHKTVGEVVGGYIEVVYPRFLIRPYVMIVCEDGLIQDMVTNRYGSALYGTWIHGAKIVGNIVLMKIGLVDGERDIVGLSDEEAETLAAKAKDILNP